MLHRGPTTLTPANRRPRMQQRDVLARTKDASVAGLGTAAEGLGSPHSLPSHASGQVGLRQFGC